MNNDALIWINSNSGSGTTTISIAALIPIPLINFKIRESEETNFLDIAQLTISEHDDDDNNYNILQASIGSEDPIEIPIPYGSFSLSYFLSPGRPSFGKDK